MSLPRVVAVTNGSPAARAGLQPGDEIVAMSGQVPRDVIQYRLLADEADVELDVDRGGLQISLTVSKEPGEALGAEVSSALFDQVRTCDNHCEFCFIFQLPPGMRKSLYLKDDDYRLSFLYGNFTTLTRFTELDLERIVTERLSPLYVSIHATDGEVRSRMLRNRRGATSLRWLRALLDHGIEVHGQVVVCPGVNDADVLDDTLAGVLDTYPELASLAVVPLGVSRWSNEAAMRPHTKAEAEAVVDSVEEWQAVFQEALGRRLVFGADEYYLLAGRPFPPADSYEGFAMHEDGIGMARLLAESLTGERDDAIGVKAGFFAWVDGAPAQGYRAPRLMDGQVAETGATAEGGSGIGIITGTYGAAVLGPLLDRLDICDVRLVPVENRFFGGNIGVTGLMVGEDVAAAGRRGRGRPLPPARRVPFQWCVPGRHFSLRPTPAGGDSADGRSLPAIRSVRCVSNSGAGVTPPVVAVVGRPNVGKSTLVNRIVGRREAIVEERPGVTRDRKELAAEWVGRSFTIVDTGGWLDTHNALDRQVSAQAERAMAGADLLLLVVDTAVGATDEDDRVARLLRRSDKPVLLVANKVDSEAREADAWALGRLGLGDPWPVSALHGRGTGDLLDEVVRLLPDEDRDEENSDDGGGHCGGGGGSSSGGATTAATPTGGHGPDGRNDDRGEGAPAVAIVGRPNVGKSTLFNRLIGDERSVVHDLPGTTRDAIDTLIETETGPLRLVDTAGMRRKSRVGEGPEYYSLVRALQAIDRADAAVLMIDATEGVTHQDQRLAERIDAAGSPIVIVLNKWETLDAEARAAVREDIADRLAFLGYAPVLKISARTGLGVQKLLPALALAIEAYHRRVPTAELNKLLQKAQAAHPPPRCRIFYATQGAVDPPTFTIFASRSLPAPYLRYLEGRIREHFGFGPTPLKLRVRRRGD